MKGEEKMAVKKVTYVEPEDYFSPEMRKVVEEAQKRKAAEKKQAGKTGGKKK